MHMDNMRNIIGCVLLALLTGCAGSPKVPAVEQTAEPVRIVILDEDEEHASLEVESWADRGVRRGVAGAVGGTSGWSAGWLAAFSCGAAAPLCMLITVPAGALAGAIGGAHHVRSDLTKDQAQRVNAAVGELNARRDVRADLVAALERALPPEMESVADCADCANVRVSIDRFNLQERGDQVSLHLTIRMRIERKHVHPGEMASRRFMYGSASKQRDVRKWLAEGSTVLDEAVSDCIDDAARRMREDLRETLRP
jgi:hypothetical protein